MNRNENGVFSQKLRAGKRRTYFFDVRETKSDDYYITITEKKRRQDGSFDRHKIYIYKEDFNKFLSTLETSMNHVKEELLPDYDFDEFTREAEEVPSYVPSDQEYLNENNEKDTSVNKENPTTDFDISF